MLVKDIGEFHLINILANTLSSSPDTNSNIEWIDELGFKLQVPLGDDAAGWFAPQGINVFTTDTMVEGVHFNLNHIDWEDLGRKALSINLSDIAAMGCHPTFSVVTLGLREDLPVNGLINVYKGILETCQTYGGLVVGGNIVKSSEFFISIAMQGRLGQHENKDSDQPHLLTRTSASPGDEIYVTGPLGCSAAGLKMMMDELQFDSNTANHLKRAHNRPTPRISEGVSLAENQIKSAIDISDGLADDLWKLCNSSNVASEIHFDQVPVDEFLRSAFPNNWIDLALNGGEDYELLFTAPPDSQERLNSILDSPPYLIGTILDGNPNLRILDAKGNVMTHKIDGWDHFAH